MDHVYKDPVFDVLPRFASPEIDAVEADILVTSRMSKVWPSMFGYDPLPTRTSNVASSSPEPIPDTT
ncbi:MAG: hypothetical protein VXB67_07625 [Deltaproteobacteria bacterium]